MILIRKSGHLVVESWVSVGKKAQCDCSCRALKKLDENHRVGGTSVCGRERKDDQQPMKMDKMLFLSSFISDILKMLLLEAGGDQNAFL